MHTILIVDIRGKKIVRQLCEKGGVDSILLLDSIYYITGKLILFYSNVIIYMYFFYNTKFLFFLFPIKSCSRFQRTLLIRYTLNGQFQSDLSCWWWNFFCQNISFLRFLYHGNPGRLCFLYNSIFWGNLFSYLLPKA